MVEAELPSTPTLASAFLRLHGATCAWRTRERRTAEAAARSSGAVGRYQRLALEHRLTLSNFYAAAQRRGLGRFDAPTARFLDGTAPHAAPGARMTTLQFTGPQGAGGPLRRLRRST